MTRSGEPDFSARALRPYVITRGRARATRNTVGVETLLIAPDPTRELPVTASREERALVQMCARLISLVEACAHLDLPVSVVGVLASDLIDAGYLSARSGTPKQAAPDSQLLQEVLHGLRGIR
ncbi:DUF742 domain-containing protein [Kineosporia sp. NBRC 101731]|uniref:DUF742 domain-containing protein n=1 Tax=Kineosporia sp. NBRC 101731 TaxID=3032199 RepID=UPI0024A1C339|nr:DUF742 domain-containing protein [Kineosporia sp. NBRC 101731]GLY33220.1 hypothetical protein Kisp02_65850 [Kineosporia sp. NBRC 101731]